MKQTSKPVCSPLRLLAFHHAHPSFSAKSELQALGDDLLEEEEMPSYLKDTTALPDFVDEAPVDASTVSVVAVICSSELH